MTDSQPAPVAAPSNTLVRNERRQKRSSVLALLLIAIAIVLVPVGLVVRNRESSQKVPFGGRLADQKGEQVEAELVWYDAALGSIGDQYYHFAQDKDYNLFVVVVNKEDSQTFEANLKADPRLAALNAEPLSLVGKIKPLATDSLSAVIERFGYYKIPGDETLTATDPRAIYGIFKFYKSETAERIWIAAVMAGFFGLISLLVAFGIRSGQKKAVALLDARRPGWAERGLLDAEPDFAIKDLELRVVDDLLIAESGGLKVADLREVSWIYLNSTRVRNSTNYSLLVHDEAGKKSVLSLPSKKRVIESEMPGFWAYINQTYPEMRIGYTMDNRQADSGKRQSK
ncbi:MAG: hypothetical protein QM270_04455 [Bacillota bacterium]|nr:hypothetical protein [Bacillota bacterium]